MICDDSSGERKRFYSRHFENFEILGVEKLGHKLIETDPIDSIEKLYKRIHEMRQSGTLPDLLILDLFYKRNLPDVDIREQEFINDIVSLKKKFRNLRDKVMGYLEPTGVAMLKQLREVDNISDSELPVAIYTDKDLNLLPPEYFNTLYSLGAETLHKDRDEVPEWQITSSAEYLRLLHIIKRSKTILLSKQSVFISHGRANCWKKLQHFIEHDLARTTIELEQRSIHGQTVIEKLAHNAKLCSHAVIVMTGDDPTVDGEARVRENVMHEIGYFQGCLGLDRVLLLREEGVSMPSNLGGIVYLQFKKGGIASTFNRLEAELRVSQ
jgi:hypothetical protein